MPSLDFEKAMELEHCHNTGATDSFTTTNHHITTTPADEWAVAMAGGTDSSHVECDMRHGRVLRTIDHHMASEAAVRAGLTRPEVIAIVLYTGPMVRLGR